MILLQAAMGLGLFLFFIRKVLLIMVLPILAALFSCFSVRKLKKQFEEKPSTSKLIEIILQSIGWSLLFIVFGFLFLLLLIVLFVDLSIS